ncbi:MAG: hypothetical protein U5N27_22620 [Rhizobium sp.]|nr:hypothetical protein [Rhizobium sp.]
MTGPGLTLYRNEVKNLIDYVTGPGTLCQRRGRLRGLLRQHGPGRATTGVTLSGATRVGAVNLERFAAI